MSCLINACRCCFVTAGPANVDLKTPLNSSALSDSPSLTPQGSPELSSRVANIAGAVLIPGLDLPQSATAGSSDHSAAMAAKTAAAPKIDSPQSATAGSSAYSASMDELDRAYFSAQDFSESLVLKPSREDEEEQGWLLDLESKGSFCPSTKPGGSRSSTPTATERLKSWFMEGVADVNEAPVAGPRASKGRGTGLRRMEDSSSGLAAAGRGPLPYDEDPTEPPSDLDFDDFSADTGWGASEELAENPLPLNIAPQTKRNAKSKEVEDFQGTKVRFADQASFAPDVMHRASHFYEEKLLKAIGEYFHKQVVVLSCDHIVSLFAGTHVFVTRRIPRCSDMKHGSALLTRDALRRLWRWEEGQIFVQHEEASNKFLDFLAKITDQWQYGDMMADLDPRVPDKEKELFPESELLNVQDLCRRLGLDSNFQTAFKNYWTAMEEQMPLPPLNILSKEPKRSILRLSIEEKLRIVQICSQTTQSPLKQKVIQAWRKKDWASTRASLEEYRLDGTSKEAKAKVEKLLCQEGARTQVKALLAVKEKEDQSQKEMDEERLRSYSKFTEQVARYKGSKD